MKDLLAHPHNNPLDQPTDQLRIGVLNRCSHSALVTGGRHPNDLPDLRWINMLLDNLKAFFSRTFHAFKFDKYAKRSLRGF